MKRSAVFSPEVMLEACCFCSPSVVLLRKLWFLDRMVWLYEDMNAQHEHYRSWLS